MRARSLRLLLQAAVLFFIGGASGLTLSAQTFKGTFLGSHSVKSTWVKSGSCNTNRPSTLNKSFSSSPFDLTGIPSNFSCDPHRFIGGSATVNPPSADVAGTIAAGPADPVVVNLSAGVAAGATLTGVGRFVSGGDRHAVRIGINIGVDDRFPEDRREPRDPGCAATDGVSNSNAGSTPLSAGAQCAVSAMDIDASSIKKETVGGVETITEFEAEVVSEIYVVMDHGTATQEKRISKGAIYTLTVRSRYKFEVGQDSLEVTEASPDPSTVLVPAEDQRFDLRIRYTLDTRDEAVIVVAAFGGGQFSLEESRVDAQKGSREVGVTVVPFEIPEGGVRLIVQMRALDGVVLAEETIVYQTGADFTIDHIEAVQVVQDELNGIPLVAGKSTLVRVFTRLSDSPESSLGGVPARLRGFRASDGSELPGSPLSPINPGALTTKSPDRANPRHSHDFRLPLPWTTVELVNLEAEVNPDGVVPESDGDNNTQETLLLFERGRSLTIKYLPVCFQLAGMEFPECPGEEVASLDGFTRKTYPVADNGVSYSPLEIPQIVWDEAVWDRRNRAEAGRRSDRFMNYLERIFDWTTAQSGGVIEFDQLVAWLPPGYSPGLLGMAGAKWAGGKGRVSFNVDTSLSDRLDTEVTLAHEMGHNLGLRHPNTADSCGARDSNTYWSPANHAIQEHGYDVKRYVFKRGKPTEHLATRFDLMSYCSPGFNFWMSPENFLRLSAGEFLPQLREEGKRPPLVEQGEDGEMALVSGFVNRDGTDGSLNPLYRFVGRPEAVASDPLADHCLLFSDGASELQRFCFPVVFLNAETAEETESSGFSFVLPLPAGAVRVALTREGRELAALSLSDNAPVVAFVSPQAGEQWDGAQARTITWTAQDADGETLVHSLFYSHDGGASWLPIVLSLSQTQYELNASQVVGGDQVMFRVLSSDGFQTGAATVGPITIVQRPAIEVVGQPVQLGKALQGSILESSITVSNPGSGSLAIQAIVSDSALFEPADQSFPVNVRAGGSRELAVRFLANDLGVQSARLTIESNADGAPGFVVDIEAEGVDGMTPALGIDSNGVAFRDTPVGERRISGLTVRNKSLAALDVQWSLTGDSFTAVETASSFTLEPAEEREIGIRFAPSAEMEFVGALTIQSNDPDKSEVQLRVQGAGFDAGVVGGGGPSVNAGGIVDAAQFGAVLARGGLGSIFGRKLAAANAAAPGLPLPTELGGVRLRVNGVDAPLLFVSAGQINFQMPFEAPLDGAVEVVVVRNGESSAPASATVAPYAPALFLSNGEPVIQRHPDLDLISASNPARAGDVLIVFLTGIGDLNNAPASGSGAPGSPPATAKTMPTATIGGVEAAVLFAGLAPGFVGLGQVNIIVPETLAAPLSEQGSVGQGSGLPLVIDFGGAANPTVNISVDIGGVPLPRMAVSPSSLAFGEVGVGESKDLALTISNPGAADLVISQPTINDPQFQLVGVLSLVIAPGGQQTATVRFRPESGGAKSATLTISGNDPANPMVQVPLSGEGGVAGPGDLQVSPSPIEFGAVNLGSSAAQTVVISNVGGQSFRVGLIRAADAQFRVEFSDQTPPVDLGPEDSFFIRVVFEPTSAGLSQTSLTVATQFFGQNITMRGTGVSGDAPSISVPSPLLFGPVPVGRVVEKTISVSNNGAASLVVSAVTSDDPQFELGDVELPFTVLPGEQQAVQIHYEPMSIGSHEATLLFENNDPGQANKPLSVVGEGTAGEPLIFSDSFDRPDGVNCAVGSADHAFGGSNFHGYAMIASGARLRGGHLENAGRAYGGVSFTTQSGGSCPGAGSDQGAELNIRADVLVPRAGDRTTQAGPFFHAPLLGSGQRIDEGGAAGYWVQLDSSGEVRVQRLDSFQQIAVSDAPADFDASVMHTIEVAVRGQSAEVTVDGRLRLFRQGAGVSARSTVNVIPTAGSNDGGAGLAFGAEDGPASPGGQQLDNIRVSGYETLLGAPVERTP